MIPSCMANLLIKLIKELFSTKKRKKKEKKKKKLIKDLLYRVL